MAFSHSSSITTLEQVIIALSSPLGRALAAFTLIAAIYLLYRDYQAFKALGPGGTPTTIPGYLKVKFLGLFAIRDPYKPLRIPPHFRPQKGYLTDLPRRAAPRPSVAGIAPQRQTTQKISGETFAKLSEALRQLAADPRYQLQEGTSCFEKHGTGLFSLSTVTNTCRGEVCHAHPSDGSMHIVLHPADAAIVSESGWGERHPLARGGWFRRFVPKEFMMVYAPQDEREVETVVEIVCAAVWWVSGISVRKGRKDSGVDVMEEKETGAAELSCGPAQCQVGGTLQKA